MKQFLSVFRLNLHMQLGFLDPRTWKKTVRGSDSNTVRQLMGILALFLFLGGYAAFLEWKAMDALVSLQNDSRLFLVISALRRQGLTLPSLLIVVVCLISMLLTFAYGLFQVLSSLYYAKDTAFYCPLPVSSRAVYAGKFAMVWLSEVGVTALFILPLTVISMIHTSFDLVFLLRAILLTFLLPMLPLSICALLTGLLAHWPFFWKHRNAITVAGTVILIVFQATLSFSFSSLSSEISDSPTGLADMLVRFLMGRTDVVDSLTRIFPPASWAGKGLIGDYGLLLLFALVSVASFALVVFLMGGSLLRLASLNGEETAARRKVDLGRVDYRDRSTFGALFRNELRQVLRSPTYFMNGFMSCVLVPVLMAGGMIMGFGSAFEWDWSVMRREVFGPDTDYTLVALIFTAIIGFMSGMNMISATSVSREGGYHKLLRSFPVSGRDALLAKAILGFLLSCIGIVIPCVAALVIFPYLYIQVIETIVWSAMLNYFFSCVDVLIDTLRPKLNWNSENEAMKQNFNSILGLLAGLATFALLGSLFYLLFRLRASFTLMLCVFTAFLGVLCVTAHLLLIGPGARRYEAIE